MTMIKNILILLLSLAFVQMIASTYTASRNTRETCGDQTCTSPFRYCCRNGTTRCVLTKDNCGPVCGKSACPRNRPHCCTTGNEYKCTTSEEDCRSKTCGDTFCSGLTRHCCRRGKRSLCTRNFIVCQRNRVCGESRCSDEQPYCCGKGEIDYCTESEQTCVYQDVSTTTQSPPQTTTEATTHSSTEEDTFQSPTTKRLIPTSTEDHTQSNTPEQEDIKMVEPKSAFNATQCGSTFCSEQLPKCCNERSLAHCISNDEACSDLEDGDDGKDSVPTTKPLTLATIESIPEDLPDPDKSRDVLPSSICAVLNCTGSNLICCDNVPEVYCSSTCEDVDPADSSNVWVPIIIVIAVLLLLIILAILYIWKCTSIFAQKANYSVSSDKVVPISSRIVEEA